MKKYIYQLAISLFMLATASNSYAHFGSKGLFGGTVTTATVNDTTVYLGTAMGGVYESTNKSLSAWRARPVGLPSGQVNALSHTGSYLFVAVGNKGVYRFTGYVGSDRYWEKTNNGIEDETITALLALDSITMIAGSENGKLFKTINKGQSWDPINNLPFSSSMIAGFAKAPNRIFLAVESKGVFVSFDNGSSWQDFNDDKTKNVSATISLSYSSSEDVLMILNNNGLFYLNNAANASSASYNQKLLANPSVAVRSIANQSNTWYLATNQGVYTTASLNDNWYLVNNGLTNTDVKVLIPFQDQLLAGTQKTGVFKSKSDTISWSLSINGFNNLKTYSMISIGDNLIVAATENGVYVSKDLANSYKASNQGLKDSLNVTDLTFFESKLIATTLNQGVFMSNDTGITWVNFNNGLSNLSLIKVFASLSSIYVFDSSGKVYQSDGVAAWLDISKGLSGNVKPTALAFSGSNLFLSTFGHGCYVKRQNTDQWVQINNGLSDEHLTSICTLGNKIYVGTDGNGVWSSDINTINWKACGQTSIEHTLTMGLDGSKIQAMNTFGGYVFASYKGGLLASSDEGKTWIQGGNQFNLPSYTAVNKISFVNSRVFVTTENNSLYSNSLSELPLNVAIEVVSYPSHKDSCNGALRAVYTGGTAPYKIEWNNSDTTVTVNNLCSGKYVVKLIANDKAFVTDTVDLITEGYSTKIVEHQQNTSFSIYPNPTQGDFTILLNGNIEKVNAILIYDQIGCLIDSFKPLNQEFKISKKYAPGIYFIQINSESGQNVQKLIVR